RGGGVTKESQFWEPSQSCQPDARRGRLSVHEERPMKDRKRFARSFLAGVGALLALGGAAATQTQWAAPTQPAAPKKSVARVNEWPKRIQLGDTTVLLDAPQVESLEGTRLKPRGTARFQRAAAEPAVASLWYNADVEIDRDRRVVTLASVNVPRLQLPGASPAKQQRLAARLGPVITRHRLTLPLDDGLAGAKLAARRDAAPPKLGTDPPKILFEPQPAVLVIFDGAPRFRAVEGTPFERALNTPFLVLHDPRSNAYYLAGGTMWFRARDAAGPWTKADDVPREAVQIARRDLEDAGIADDEIEKAAQSREKRVPKILVGTEPTDLIVSDGPPQWRPEVEGELETMSNTEGDVFRTVSDGRLWLVLSGRWYWSNATAGPWTYVSPDDLPASFRRIPADSEKAAVLTFVPGTAPARDALRDANTPRTAAVRRSDAHVEVTYDGEPKFA